jgi:hypothetical protein
MWLEIGENIMYIYFKSIKGNFNAKGVIKDNKVLVLKNSIISDKKYNCKISEKIKDLRNNQQIVFNHKVLKDIEFDSLSSAAQFVSGYKANGLRVWKDINGCKIDRKVIENG